MNIEVIKAACKRFLKDEDGATAIEYALMAALIAGVIVAAVGGLGTQVSDTFDDIKTAITGGGSSGGGSGG